MDSLSEQCTCCRHWKAYCSWLHRLPLQPTRHIWKYFNFRHLKYWVQNTNLSRTTFIVKSIKVTRGLANRAKRCFGAHNMVILSTVFIAQPSCTILLLKLSRICSSSKQKLSHVYVLFAAFWTKDYLSWRQSLSISMEFTALLHFLDVRYRLDGFWSRKRVGSRFEPCQPLVTMC